MQEKQLQFNYDGFDINDFCSEKLELSSVGGCDISTVKLPKETYPDGVWETCVFYADDTSQVLEQYTSEVAARAGHRKYVDEMIVIGEQE
jgi:hypothetical protein